MEAINCKEIAQKWKDEIKKKNLKAKFCVIQVGDDPASNAYVKGKIKDAEEIGFECVHEHIPALDIRQVYDAVAEKLFYCQNPDNGICGVILQLPLPFGLTFEDFIDFMRRRLDVDGFLPDSDFKPCTPDAVMTLLDELGVDLAGKNCVVVGRSEIVGRPLAQMLLDKNATVTVCHSHTPMSEIYDFASKADVFISAVGKPKFIDSICFKDGATVIDVGISRTEGGIKGDIFINPYSADIKYTTVPGGVGLLTRAMLMRHVAEAYENNFGGKND